MVHRPLDFVTPLRMPRAGVSEDHQVLCIDPRTPYVRCPALLLRVLQSLAAKVIVVGIYCSSFCGLSQSVVIVLYCTK